MRRSDGGERNEDSADLGEMANRLSKISQVLTKGMRGSNGFSRLGA